LNLIQEVSSSDNDNKQNEIVSSVITVNDSSIIDTTTTDVYSTTIADNDSSNIATTTTDVYSTTTADNDSSIIATTTTTDVYSTTVADNNSSIIDILIESSTEYINSTPAVEVNENCEMFKNNNLSITINEAKYLSLYYHEKYHTKDCILSDFYLNTENLIINSVMYCGKKYLKPDAMLPAAYGDFSLCPECNRKKGLGWEGRKQMMDKAFGEK